MRAVLLTGLTIALLLVAAVLAPGLRGILGGFALARTQVVQCRRAAGGMLTSALLAALLARLLTTLLLSRLLVTLLLSRLRARLPIALLLAGLHAVLLLLPRMHVARLLLATLGDLAARGVDAQVIHVIIVARTLHTVSFVFTHTRLLFECRWSDDRPLAARDNRNGGGAAVGQLAQSQQ
ncbi:membrane hypothetical protein [Massilia sp. 9I]|nr:membrane hypothetical protein [Massilia sp. 9I]